jgi:hypothetical protein
VCWDAGLGEPWDPPSGQASCWCREVCVWAQTEVTSLCLLHSNTRLCHLWSQSSIAGSTGSWMYLLSWWLDSWGMDCFRYSHFYRYTLSTAVPSLSAGRSSSSCVHCWWSIQRQHK